MNQRPIIGITSDSGHLVRNSTYSGLEIYFSQRMFADAIVAVGGLPWIIPMHAQQIAEPLMDELDGLILIGGHDVSPRYYDQEPREKLGVIKPDRDASDVALLQAAIAKDIPVLGICRGLQLMNAALGGTLYQDLSENSDIKIQHDQLASPEQVVHKVIVDQDSYLSHLIEDGAYVNSVHHQVIDELAPSLQACAWSGDGVIEAVVSGEDVPQMVGLQWHPETLYQVEPAQLAFFEDLIRRAQAKK